MSITVVTVRGDTGAPTTWEVYAEGARYNCGNGDLDILSAEMRVLGFYPSGNWMSVYVDDCVQVRSGYADPPADAAAAAEGELEGGDMPGDTTTAAGRPELVSVGAFTEYDTAEQEATPGRSPSRSSGDRPALRLVTDGDTVSDSAPADVEPDESMLPPLTDSPVHDNTPSAAPVTKDPGWPGSDRGGRPAHMIPVAFTPKPMKARPRPAAPDEDQKSHIRPIVFRPRSYRGVSSPPKPSEPTDDDGSDD
jgi:hypothetical protein